MERTENLRLKKPSADEYFDVDLLNENSDIIDKNIYEAKGKIGDIRITTREMSDPSWLLCPNMDVNETNFPELYYILSSKADIFKGEWSSVEGINTQGVKPITVFGDDGNEHIYLVSDDRTTVYQYNALLEKEDEFERVRSGPVLYENGLWFAFGSGSDLGTVYFSSDCFKMDNRSVKVESLTDNGEFNASGSSVRFSDGKWMFTFRYSDNDFKSRLYISETDSVDSAYHSGGYIVISKMSYYHVDRIIFKNGAAVALLTYKATSSGTSSYKTCLYYIPSWIDRNNIEWISLRTSMSHSMSINYISQLDAVTCDTLTVMNDGTVLKINLRSVFFKGFLYKRLSNEIYRYDANNLGEPPVVKTEYVTGKIFASSRRLYMVKDENSVYYIENENTLSIPEAHPNSIFKTYIKAK